MSETRPWLRAIGWIALLGAFFFASYGFANSLASQREGVGSIAYPWESAIPFVPWTIVPYWSIDLLYGLSLLICLTRRELDRHAQRLLAVQLVCIAFFIAFPLRFSFDRPVADGMAGALFAALGAFDKPFNQAPSLHIALLVVIWVRLVRHCPRFWRPALHAWMLLIGGSVLTTYQHHFIDIPTGAAVGFAVLWALPEERASPLAGLAFTRDATRRRLALRYLLAAVTLAMPGFMGGAWLWLVWPSLSLGLVALNYAAVGPEGFEKSSNGRLSAGATALFGPYLLGAWINSRAWTFRQPRPVEVVDGVFLGRIPSARELGRMPFAAVVDLAAELPCGSREGVSYRSVPVLDLTAPDLARLREAAEHIEELRARGAVLVCCALGYSRSAAAVAAWLLETRRASSVEEAMEIIRRARPSVVLANEHQMTLEAIP